MTIAPSTLPRPSPASERGRELAVKAAQWTFWPPFLCMGLNILFPLIDVVPDYVEVCRAFIPGLCLELSAHVLICAIGVALGCFALFATRRYGREGIWHPAVEGVVINGTLLLFILGLGIVHYWRFLQQ